MKSPFLRWMMIVCALSGSLKANPPGFHAFHTSLAQVQYDANAKILEVSVRVFTDDLETALTRENGNRHVKLEASEQHNSLVETYVNKHFGFTNPQGQKQKMTFLGREFEADATWIYLEVPLGEQIAGFRLQNTLLVEVFADQTNVVNLTYFSTKKTYLFNADKPTQPLGF